MEESQAPEAAFVSEHQLVHEAALRILSDEPEAKAEEAKPEEAAPEVKAEEPKPEEKSEEVKAEIRRLKLRYNGEEIEKEEPEVIELAQKGFDYTKKTMDLARERDEWRAKSKQEQEAKLSEYDKQLETYKQAALRLADQEAMTVDLNKVAESDPSKAQQLFFKRLEINQTLTAIAQEQEKIATQRQTEAKEQFQKQAKEAVEILQKDIPGWSNDLYSNILKSGVEQGFKEDAVKAITDPVAIKVLWKAKMYDDLQKAKPQVEKKVEKVPKVAKPGTAEKPDQNAEQWKQGMAKLQKSGGRDMRTATELAKKFL